MFSHHVWHVHTIQDLGLYLLRFGNVIFMTLIIVLYFSQVRVRDRWRSIPIGVRVFTITWTFYWGLFATYVFLTNSNPFGEWFRTLYGTGYLGMLTGLIWCLWYVTKTTPQDRLLKLVYNSVMEQLAERKILEDVSTTARAERVESGRGG